MPIPTRERSARRPPREPFSPFQQYHNGMPGAVYFEARGGGRQ